MSRHRAGTGRSGGAGAGLVAEHARIRTAPPAGPPLQAVSVVDVRNAPRILRSPPAVSTARPDLGGAVAVFVRRHRVSLVILCALLVLCGIVHGVGMYRSPAAFDDEGTYVAQAWAVERHGTLAHYTYWYDHPPAGWIQMAAYFWVTRAFDRLDFSIEAGREFMLLVHLVSCCLLYVLARRLDLGRASSSLAVCLFSLSPLAINYQRMVFLDNLGVLWILAALALAASPRKSAAAAAGSGLCAAVAILSKETLLVLLPAVVWVLWRNWDVRTRRFNIIVFASLFMLTAAIYPLYATVKNELLPGAGHVSLLWAIHWQLFSRAGSGSVLDHDSGARGLLDSWLSQDPWLVTLGCVLAPVALALSRLRPIGFALGIQVVLMLRGGYLPVPYVIGLLPFAALIIAGVVDAVWKSGLRLQGRLRLAVLTVTRPAVATGLAALVVAVSPAWAAGAREQMTDRDVYVADAIRWVEQEVPRGKRVLVDDTLWVDLAERGFSPGRLEVIWSFKADLDPAVRRQLPNGWRDLDFLVLKDVGDLSELPIQRAALENSTMVAEFGVGAEAITIRRVENGRHTG
jgi:4-amino-4-deoxy-L-arabinose transferase-like glycosyltransferase